MVKWSAYSSPVKEDKSKDGLVSFYRALIKLGIRSHSNQREILGKVLKNEGKHAIDQSKCSKDHHWVRISKRITYCSISAFKGLQVKN